MSDPAQDFVTEEEYLRTEALSPFKREYVAGYVYPLHGRTLAQAGASSRHARICVNLILALGPAVRRRGCDIYQSDMCVNVRAPTGRSSYFYLDVVATCEEVSDSATSLKAPSLIVEVLSPSTGHTDRTDKLWAYTSLPSLQTYLIIKPDDGTVRVIERHGDEWMEYAAEGEMALPYLGTSLRAEEIFAR